MNTVIERYAELGIDAKRELLSKRPLEKAVEMEELLAMEFDYYVLDFEYQETWGVVSGEDAEITGYVLFPLRRAGLIVTISEDELLRRHQMGAADFTKQWHNAVPHNWIQHDENRTPARFC